MPGLIAGGRRPSEGGVRGIPGPSPGGLDPAAVAALSEPAARPDRSADLRPRMATRLRQAAAAAVVAGRGRVPGVRHRRCLLRAGAGRRRRGLLAGLGDGIAAGRGAPRTRRGPDRRRPALFPVHGREVQSRRHPAAVLGACRLCLPRRTAARADAALVPARHRDRRGAMGEVLRCRAGGPVRPVPADRQRGAQVTANAWPVGCRRHRAGDHGPSSHLAGAERLPAAPAYASARAAPSRGLIEAAAVLHPATFADRRPRS